VPDGKIQEFNCHIGVATMFAQLSVAPWPPDRDRNVVV